MKLLGFAAAFVAACAAQTEIDPLDANFTTFANFDANTTRVPFNDPAFLSAEPIAIREVSIDRTFGQPRVGGDISWTWKLAISEVILPNRALDENGSSVPDSRVAWTTFNLSWPQDGNQNVAAANEWRGRPYTNESCIYHLWTTLPQNVSDGWDPESSSCRSAIGQECEAYILRNLGTRAGCRSDNTPALSMIPACQGSFSNATGGITTQSYPFGDVNGPRDDGVGFQSGDRIAWRIDTWDNPFESNATALEMAANRLYMMIMRNSWGTQLVCNRVGNGIGSVVTGSGNNSTATDDNVAADNSTGTDDNTGTNDSTEDDEEGGSIRHAYPSMLLLLVCSAALFVGGLGDLL